MGWLQPAAVLQWSTGRHGRDDHNFQFRCRPEYRSRQGPRARQLLVRSHPGASHLPAHQSVGELTERFVPIPENCRRTELRWVRMALAAARRRAVATGPTAGAEVWKGPAGGRGALAVVARSQPRATRWRPNSYYNTVVLVGGSPRPGVAAGTCVGRGPGAARADGPGMECAPGVPRGSNSPAGARSAVPAVRSYRAVRLAARQAWS